MSLGPKNDCVHQTSVLVPYHFKLSQKLWSIFSLTLITRWKNRAVDRVDTREHYEKGKTFSFIKWKNVKHRQFLPAWMCVLGYSLEQTPNQLKEWLVLICFPSYKETQKTQGLSLPFCLATPEPLFPPFEENHLLLEALFIKRFILCLLDSQLFF